VVLTKWNADFKVLITFITFLNAYKFQPISLFELNDEELYKEAENRYTTKNYDHDISPDLVHQILSFRSCFKDKILIKSKTTK